MQGRIGSRRGHKRAAGSLASRKSREGDAGTRWSRPEGRSPNEVWLLRT